MKQDWTQTALSEACQMRPEKSEARKNVPAAAPVSFLPMEDLGIDQKFVTPRQSRKLNEVIGSYTYFAEGDVLLAKITPCFENGKLGIATGLINGVGFGSSEYFVLRPKANVSPAWLYYFLSREGFRIEGAQSMSGAVGHKRVEKTFVENQLFSVPPLPEQHRIVRILDEAFAAIAKAEANTEENLQNARAVFKNYLQSVFTQRGDQWTEAPLGDIATFRNGINFTKRSLGEKIKVVGVKDFQSNFRVPLDHLETVTTDGTVAELDLLKVGDILTVRSNGNIELIGRSLLATDVQGRISHSGFTIRVRLQNTEMSSEYLCHFMKSDNARRNLIQSGTGINIKSLNQQGLSALIVPFPPRAQQIAIVHTINEVSNNTQQIESAYRNKLRSLAELKQSLLHQAFSGNL